MLANVLNHEEEEETMAVNSVDVLNKVVEVEVEGEEEEEDDDWSSDSEIGDALDWLDLKDVNEGGVEGGSITLNARRPNAHGGALSRPTSSALQPLSNRTQKFTHRIRASPLEVLNFMYSSVFGLGLHNVS